MRRDPAAARDRPSDLILFIVVGDLIQHAVTQSDYSFVGAVVALGTIAVLVVVMQYGNFRSGLIRGLMEDEPLVVVEDAEVLQRNPRRLRLTTVELASHARLDGIASLDDVRWAIVETSGDISFILGREDEDRNRHEVAGRC